MNNGNLLVAAVVIGVLGFQISAHPGPERHPTIDELKDTASEIQTSIIELEHRISERFDELKVANDIREREAADLLNERVVSAAVADFISAADELRARLDTLATIGAIVLVVLTGSLAFLAVRLRKMGKLLRNVRKADRASNLGDSERADMDSEENEDREEDGVRRIVTHTLKDRISSGVQPTVKELHNPDAAWSPRTRDEAINDIREEGIQYWARGPLGNEAEIEVRERHGKPYLSTKPDEHEGNNLTELPDPPST